MLKRTTTVALWSSTLAGLMTVYGCGAAQLGSAAKTTAGADGSAGSGATSSSSTGGSLALSEPSSSAAVAKFRLAILNKDVCEADQDGGDDHGKEGHGRGPGKGHARPELDGKGPGQGPGKGEGRGPGKVLQRPVASGMIQIPIGQLPWDKITAAISAAISAYTANSLGSTTASSTATTTASLEDNAPAETAADNSAGAASSSPGAASSSAAGSVASTKKCVVKSLEQAYVAGKAISIDNIPVGTYTLQVMLADANGHDLEMGSTSITITQGATATADITLAAVQSGSVAVSIHEAVTKLVVASAALAQPAQICGEVKIESQSYYGNPAIVASALLLNLASSAATGAFYSDAACTLQVTSITLAAAASDISVYYKDSAAGAPTLTVTDSSANPLTAASQTEVVAAQ